MICFAIVAAWEQEIGLMISNTEYFQNYQSYCIGINCTVCDQNDGYFSRNHHSVLYETHHYPWAAALGGLSLLGALLTILTALYFPAAAALPKNNVWRNFSAWLPYSARSASLIHCRFELCIDTSRSYMCCMQISTRICLHCELCRNVAQGKILLSNNIFNYLLMLFVLLEF
jgi:hypothetical protein